MNEQRNQGRILEEFAPVPWMWIPVVIAVVIVTNVILFGTRELVLWGMLLLLAVEVLILGGIVKYFRKWYQRNYVGFSVLFYTINGELKRVVFSNNSCPPLVRCDGFAFSVPLGGVLPSHYCLQHCGNEWQRLDYVVDAETEAPGPIPRLTLAEKSTRKIIVTGVYPWTALSTLERTVLSQVETVGRRVNILA